MAYMALAKGHSSNTKSQVSDSGPLVLWFMAMSTSLLRNSFPFSFKSDTVRNVNLEYGIYKYLLLFYISLSNLRSRIMRKPDFCLCENKGADQLRSNWEADQRLHFRYTGSTIPLLLISERIWENYIY